MKAYYIQHSLWNQNTTCPYKINSSDTLSLLDDSIDFQNCKKDFVERQASYILWQADYYWKDKEFDSARKYYRDYLVRLKEDKVDSSIIPKYIYRRLKTN